ADDEAACAAAQRAIDFARTAGLGEYHGIAPAVAIRAATSGDEATAIAEAEHAVVLAHRATTMLGLVFVLSLAGDVLLEHGAESGRDLIAEAREVMKRCADAGINVALLERVAARNRVARPKPAPTAGL